MTEARDIGQVAVALADRRAMLIEELRGIEDKLDDPVSKDWEDRSSERQFDEVLEARGNRELVELKMIDAALARIDDGTFGLCTKCHNPIEAERLRAIPETPLCAACATS